MPELDFDQVLISLVKQSPARVLEAYYWSGEEGLLQFIRSFLRLPAKTQEALKALLQTTLDPQTVAAAFDDQGQLTLRSDNASKAVTFVIGAGERALQISAAQPCAIG